MFTVHVMPTPDIAPLVLPSPSLKNKTAAMELMCTNKPRHEISKKCGNCDQQRLRSACAYAQSDQSLFQSLEYPMDVKLLTKFFLEFLSIKAGCTGMSKSYLVKMPHCWKSHITAQTVLLRRKKDGHQSEL